MVKILSNIYSEFQKGWKWFKCQMKKTNAETTVMGAFVGGIIGFLRNALQNYDDPTILAVDRDMIITLTILFVFVGFTKLGRDQTRKRVQAGTEKVELETRKLAIEIGERESQLSDFTQLLTDLADVLEGVGKILKVEETKTEEPPAPVEEVGTPPPPPDTTAVPPPPPPETTAAPEQPTPPPTG